MLRFASLVAVALFMIPAVSLAQGTLVVSQQKCAGDKQAQLRQMTDSQFIPIAQELVNEGKLEAAGSAFHSWGDEWNVVIWYTAADIPTFLTAWSELFSRLNQRHPTLIPQFQSWCSEHKDNFYTQGKVTTPRPAAPARRP